MFFSDGFLIKYIKGIYILQENLEMLCNQITEYEWDKFVETNETSSMAHLYGWKNVIENSYGHKAYYFHLIENGEILAISPFVFIKSRIFGKQLVSMPFLDYGGICVKKEYHTKSAVDKVLESVLVLSKELNADFIDLRHLHNINSGWKTKLEKVTMIMDLKSSEDSMWKALASERRNRIRKALKNDLEASFFGSEAVDEFYNIFAENMRDLGSPVHSKLFFMNIMKIFDTMTKIILVKQKSNTIGAALCFFFKDTISIPWVSSLRSHFTLYPNNILYWEAIKYAINQGYRRFDFGRSSQGSGTYDFKKRWGAKPVQLFWDYYDKKNIDSSSRDFDSSLKYQVALKIWQKIPVSLSKVIGPTIRKNISN